MLNIVVNMTGVMEVDAKFHLCPLCSVFIALLWSPYALKPFLVIELLLTRGHHCPIFFFHTDHVV